MHKNCVPFNNTAAVDTSSPQSHFLDLSEISENYLYVIFRPFYFDLLQKSFTIVSILFMESLYSHYRVDIFKNIVASTVF